MKKKQKYYFKNFHNTLIKKLKIRGLKNIDLLQELPFYDELNIYEISKAFGWYARSYKVELVDSKYPLVQLKASKSSIKYLLDKIKGFKYQTTVKASLLKRKKMEPKKLLLFILILLLKQ